VAASPANAFRGLDTSCAARLPGHAAEFQPFTAAAERSVEYLREGPFASIMSACDL